MDLKKAGKESEALVLTPKALYFRMPGEPQVEIPITGIIATLENKRPIDKAALLVVDTEGNGRKLRLVLQTIELRDYGNGDRRIQSLHGYLLLGGSR